MHASKYFLVSATVRHFTCSAWEEGPQVPRHLRSDEKAREKLLGRLQKLPVSGYSHQTGNPVVEICFCVAQVCWFSIEVLEDPSDTLGWKTRIPAITQPAITCLVLSTHGYRPACTRPLHMRGCPPPSSLVFQFPRGVGPMADGMIW